MIEILLKSKQLQRSMVFNVEDDDPSPLPNHRLIIVRVQHI